MKRKKLLTKLLCAAVVGNMAVGIIPGTLLTTEAAETQNDNAIGKREVGRYKTYYGSIGKEEVQ